MSDISTRRHGLEPLHIAICSGVGQINLRGDPLNPAFTEAAERALGQKLPLAANTTSAGEHRICWLGPDEWQITTAAASVSRLSAVLDDAFAQCHSSVLDLSGGMLTLQFRGNGARGVLAKGCTLDLSAARFGTGACAQSGLAKAGMLISCLDDAEPLFEIVVRRSFADYALRWLHHACGGRSVSVSEAEWAALKSA